MKRNLLAAIFTIIGILAVSGSVLAQKQIEPKVQRDPLLEQDAAHNLEVANQYFKLKKAYVGSLTRCEEIIAANPAFSRMDEVLFVAGMSSYYLSEGKGKQKPVLKNDDDRKKYEAAKLREDALAYLSQLKENYPQSLFLADAEKIIQILDDKK
jgi:outer membrane protein assembly factor BamD (BamD/ComL family)